MVAGVGPVFTISSVAVQKKPILVSITALLKSRCNRRLLTGMMHPYPILRNRPD